MHAHVEGDTKQTKCENKVIEVGFLWGNMEVPILVSSKHWIVRACSRRFLVAPKNDPKQEEVVVMAKQ